MKERIGNERENEVRTEMIVKKSKKNKKESIIKVKIGKNIMNKNKNIK